MTGRAARVRRTPRRGVVLGNGQVTDADQVRHAARELFLATVETIAPEVLTTLRQTVWPVDEAGDASLAATETLTALRDWGDLSLAATRSGPAALGRIRDALVAWATATFHVEEQDLWRDPWLLDVAVATLAAWAASPAAAAPLRWAPLPLRDWRVPCPFDFSDGPGLLVVTLYAEPRPSDRDRPNPPSADTSARMPELTLRLSEEWDLTRESREAFLDRVRRAVEAHEARLAPYFRGAGWTRPPTKRVPAHVAWLVRYQVGGRHGQGLTVGQIARLVGRRPAAVEKAITRTADAIGLPLRPGQSRPPR